MKKLSTLLLVALISLGAMAEEAFVLDSIITKSEMDKPMRKEAYVYTGSSNASELTVSQWNDASGWNITDSYRLSYIMNSDGSVATQTWNISTASGYTPMYRVHYTYEEGRVAYTIKESLSAVGNTWNKMLKMTYSYDANGNISEMHELYWNNNNWEDYYTYQFNEETSLSDHLTGTQLETGYETEGALGIIEMFYSQHEVTAVEQIATDKRSQKIIVDGQLYIIRDGVRYNALGARM